MHEPKIIKLNIFKDKRGSFKKLFDTELTSKIKINFKISQVNISSNKLKGTIRGMHGSFIKYKEAKLIYCLSGKICDVAINYNKTNKFFLKKYYFKLDSKDEKLLFIPPGYLHGFQTLEKNTNLMYFHNVNYILKNEIGLNPLDEKLNIKWPIKITKISNKDLSLPNFSK